MKSQFVSVQSLLSCFQAFILVSAASFPLQVHADGWDEEQEFPEFTSESSLFRGTNERQATLEQVIRMLTRTHAPDEVIPSRRWKNLRSFFPHSVTQAEISRQIQQDLDFLRSKKILRTYAACHSDWRECTAPEFEDLLGQSFAHLFQSSSPDSLLHAKMSELQRQHQSPTEVEKSLYFFDPVISTSVSVDVARSFARDEHSESGTLLFAAFVLELKDIRFRHCSETTRKKDPWSCVTSATEYAEELEYPFFGWIEAEEIVGLERGGTQLSFDPTLSQIQIDSQIARETPRIFLKQPIVTGNCPDSDSQDLRNAVEIPESWKRLDSALREALVQENWICLFSSRVKTLTLEKD